MRGTSRASYVSRTLRTLLGERPRAVLLFAAPTLLAIALDLCLRARSLVVFPPKEWLNYFGSSLASAGFWSGPLWLMSRFFGRRTTGARVATALFCACFVFPLSAFCFGGQLLYFRVFHAYMARDTVRLGIALRGTLGSWLASWGASVILMCGIGLAASAAIVALARRAGASTRTAWPVVPAAAFGVAAFCFWVDFVESRSLQAAPPDTCFIHGVVHAIHDGLTGKGWARRGVSLREPYAVPPLEPPAHRPNVVLVVTESVRADAMCSSPDDGCRARFLDEVAPDRVSLGKLTSQSSGTFTSCVVLWTGLPPNSGFADLHHAPVLWEIAHAVGYRTAYIGSQNLRYDDFGAFLQRAGIDVAASAVDLGGASDPHIGAPDENATARLVEFVRGAPQPYFAVLHLSNTHWPYRVDPALHPFSPHDASPLGDIEALRNHYRNSVLFQERTVAGMLRELRALPGWDDTVVIFLSDHGEEFREHGGLYHLTSLLEEEVRVPGWLLAGDNALRPEQREALAAWRGRRTYSQDLNATAMDLLGVIDRRPALPFADRLTGRSLLRPPPAQEPAVFLSTASGVWEPDDAKYGVMRGDMLAVRTAASGWWCYDTQADPAEHHPRPTLPGCIELGALGDAGYEDLRKR
jgi:glucan phosphoethanolaminetransferase (alkaline phosphatase superfamily)